MRKHFLLIYHYAPDYIERRAEFRSLHLTLATKASDAGDLILGGALTDPFDTGLLLFHSIDKSTAEAFATSDPYVTNGLVERFEVRHWATVAGSLAAEPI
jgi:uncharacterized protein YciI